MGISDAWREDAQQQACESLDCRTLQEVSTDLRRRITDGGITNSSTNTTAPRSDSPQVGVRRALRQVCEIRGARAFSFGRAIQREAGSAGSGSSITHAATGSASGAGALSNLQVRLGGDRGKNTQRSGNSFCLPVLHGFASSAGAGAWIQENAARSLGEAAPG